MNNIVVRGLIAVVCAAGMAVVAPGTGNADPSSCTATPGQGSASSGGTATCPAGAGEFWFRVAVDCYDGYPTFHFTGVRYGPWTWAGGTSVSTSSVPCHGYVPGSGVGLNARVETR